MAEPIEYLRRPLIDGPILTSAVSKSTQHAARISVASGDTTAALSTSIVRSDSLFQLAIQSSVASNVAQVVKVASINPGNVVIFGINPAPVGTDFTIHATLIQTSGG